MRSRPRIVFFSSGSPLSQTVLRAIQRDVIRVVTSAEIDATPECDLICVASFPRILPETILQRAAIGGLNLHTSLLPRHRGPDPIFWTYFDDDHEAGVTLHWLDEGVDSGDIIAQKGWPLRRGERATELYRRQSEEGAALVADAVERIARGETLPRVPQDSARATIEPSPAKRTWAIDFAAWPAERVWHVLQGMSPLRRDLLEVPYLPQFSFRQEPHGGVPGTVEVRGGSIRIHCRDGVVEGKVLPLVTRVRRWLRRVRSA